MKGIVDYITVLSREDLVVETENVIPLINLFKEDAIVVASVYPV